MHKPIQAGGYYRDADGRKWVVYSPESFKIVGLDRLNAVFPDQPVMNYEAIQQIMGKYSTCPFFGINYDDIWAWMPYDNYGIAFVNTNSLYNLIAPA